MAITKAPTSEAEWSELSALAVDRFDLSLWKRGGRCDHQGCESDAVFVLRRCCVPPRLLLCLEHAGLDLPVLSPGEREPQRWQCGTCGASNVGDDLSAACVGCGEDGDGPNKRYVPSEERYLSSEQRCRLLDEVAASFADPKTTLLERHLMRTLAPLKGFDSIVGVVETDPAAVDVGEGPEPDEVTLTLTWSDE